MKKILSIIVFNLIIVSNSMATEQLKYETLDVNKVYAIRKYSDRLVIETETSNQNSSFRKLFNYISGINENNTPSPSNSEVTVLNMKGGYFAAITYSGRASDKNFIKHKEILENQLKEDKITILSPPIRATYNSPFTLPMLRRNEVMFEIERNT